MAIPLVLLLFIAVTWNAYAERFVFTPVADTALIEWLPTNNLGKSLRLRTGGDSRGRARALVEFDLNSISPTSRVVYARANFRVFYPPTVTEGEGRSLAGLKLFRQLRGWNEGMGAGDLGQPENGDGASWQFAEGASSPWF